MTDSNVAYYAQNANLQFCRLTTSGGDVYDLKNMVVEMSYHEDIFSFSPNGYLMIRDGMGLIEAFQLAGRETLEIRFDRTKNDYDKSPVQKFVVYRIADRRPTGNMNSEFYKLYFCTHDMFFNEQIRVSKSYKGKKIDEIVEDILRNKLGSSTTLYVQPTTGYYDFIIPMLKPYQSISWLSNYARPENSGANGLTGADMFLFQNRYGYFFNSLSTLMRTESYNDYNYQQNNLDPDVEDLQSENDSVISFEIVKSFDTLKSINSGAYANKVIAINPLTKTAKTKVFDYSKYIQQMPPANEIGVLPEIVNPLGQLPNEAFNSKIRVVMTNSGDKTNNYIKNKYSDSVTEDTYIQDAVSIRAAQVALMQRTVIKIVVPGDSHLTVGKTINFNCYSLQLKSGVNSRDLDPFYSGKYLITAVRHLIQSQGVFQTILELSRDGPSKTNNETGI